MRMLERNKQQFYYSLYEGESEELDKMGNPLPKYSEPIPLKANISPAKGSTEVEQFGTSIEYDRVIVTDDMKCKIDENSVLFINVKPAFDECGIPLGDYVVKRAARSLNNISYAISRVDVS